MTRLQYLLLAALAPALAACATPRLHLPVVRPDVDATRLAVGADTLTVFAEAEGRRIRTGRIVDHLEVVQWQGRPALRRAYTTWDRYLGNRADTLVDFLPDLQPALYHSIDSQEQEQLTFGGGWVNGRRTPHDGDSMGVADTLAPAVINYASWDLLIRSADLAFGWSATTQAYLSRRGVLTLTARVSREESVTLSDGSVVQTWVVDGDFAGTQVTFWVNRIDRRLVMQLMRFSNGVNIYFVR